MQIEINLGLASCLLSSKALDDGKDIINAISILKKNNCKVTYWNNNSDLGFNEVEHQEVSVNPPDNKYYTKDIYKVPLVNYTS